MSDRLGRALGHTAAFTALYVATTYAGRLTVLDATNLSLVWPAAGVLAVWALNRGRSRYWWIDVLALVLITLAVDHATGTTLPLAGLFAVANLAQAVVFVALARRWLPFPHAGDRTLATLDDLWRFVGAAVISTAAGAAIGPTAVGLESGHYSIESASVWLSRNLVAVIVIGIPLHGLLRPGLRWRPRGITIEYGLVAVASAVSYVFTFGLADALPIAFALIAMSVWAGLRLRTPFVMAHSLVFGVVAVLYTLRGSGSFAQIEDHSVRALVAQLFVGTVAIVGLALALGRDEREALLDRVRDSERDAIAQARTVTTIVDAMTEGLAVIDEHGKFLVRNPAGARLLGISSETDDVPENGFYGLSRADGTPLARDERLVNEIFAGRFRPLDLLVRNENVPDGRIIHVTGTELPADDHGVRRALIIFHDVTADRRHRDELAAFAGVVAHDLQNPLTTVEGWSEELAAEVEGPAADAVTRIRRAATRMRLLINGLLAYTTARDASLSPTAVDLDGLVRDIATDRLDHAESMNAPMPRFDIGDLAVVDADPVLTRQLLENVIGNAIKYTAPGVVPHITVRATPTGDGFVRIAVDDNGIGIPDGQHEAIFQNFHRAHPGLSYKGTGLGLAICKRIVERHGGTITATGNREGGSRMVFTLPTV